ncbi:hypothetical protein NE664_08500 [Anaerotignum faecicola]|nr:hypothetical protein [Anaerotignum faecicola]
MHTLDGEYAAPTRIRLELQKVFRFEAVRVLTGVSGIKARQGRPRAAANGSNTAIATPAPVKTVHAIVN